MKELGLSFIWKVRLGLWAEGAKLWAEGDKLWAKGAKLWAEGAKLWAEGAKLWAEGDKLWAEAILEVHGNITIEWIYRTNNQYACKLATGKIFEPEG
jgi:hypothetical protein